MKSGWTTKRLGEVCRTIQDGAHESPKVQFDSAGPNRFLYITSKNIRNNYLDLGKVSYVEQSFHDRIYPRCRPERGDVLLTKDGANTGQVALNSLAEPFSLLSSVCLIKTRADALLPAFLCYYIQSPSGLASITGQMTGAAIKRIILRDIKLAPIPVPPLPEQRRIVALLDEAFAGLATAAANAERNLDNARELFESHLAEVFSWRGDGWVETTLGEIADFKNGLNYTRSSRGQTIPFVGVGDFKSNLVVPVAELESVTIDGVLPPDYALETGDILMVRSNGSRDLVGRSMLVPPMKGPTSFSGFLIRVRGKRSAVDPEFLVYLLRCRDTKEQLKRGGGGASISNINQKVLAGLRLRLPPKMAQRRVVKLLDALSLETDRLSRLYEQKQAALAELKKSLLHQAFSGAL